MLPSYPSDLALTVIHDMPLLRLPAITGVAGTPVPVVDPRGEPKGCLPDDHLYTSTQRSHDAGVDSQLSENLNGFRRGKEWMVAMRSSSSAVHGEPEDAKFADQK